MTELDEHTAMNGPAPDAAAPAKGREASLALFRAHATARLRDDTAEAARLAAAIGDERRMTHHLFLVSLFTSMVLTELGDRPDPCDLAELTRILHDKHHRPDGRFKAIKAEALVRAVCGEPLLLTEISYAEQPTYLWAVMTELVPPPEATDEALAEHFRVADDSGAAWREAALETPFFAPREPAATTDPDPETETDSDPEAAQANRQEPKP